MEKVDFDKYADDYDKIIADQTQFFSDNDKYFAEYKINAVVAQLNRSPKKILEYGCGTGRNLQYFRDRFPEAAIFGVDISAQSIAVAREQNPFANCYRLGDQSIPDFGDFDLIFVAGVFHHIAPPERPGVLGEIKSLLSDDGSIFVFEHNPYNPVTRKLVRECPFDTDASLLTSALMKNLLTQAGFSTVKKKYTLFIPPAFSGLLKIEPYLGWLPLGGQYFIQAKKHSTH